MKYSIVIKYSYFACCDYETFVLRKPFEGLLRTIRWNSCGQPFECLKQTANRSNCCSHPLEWLLLSVRTASVIRSNGCSHPFERLWSSVRTAAVNRSNGSCHPFGIFAKPFERFRKPFERFVKPFVIRSPSVFFFYPF